MAKKKWVCRQCGHERRQHSIIGCLHNGNCDQGCMVAYMQKEMFEEVTE